MRLGCVTPGGGGGPRGGPPPHDPFRTAVGKLTITKLLPELIQQQCQDNDIQLLEVKLEHIYALKDLQNHHRDPFDRLLIAQTQTENMTLVSADRVFTLYDVNLFW